MTKATIAAGAAVLLALAAGCSPLDGDLEVDETTLAAASDWTAAAAENHPSFLYGRITTDRGDTYEGRLRFRGDQEAFWGDYFNGFRAGNPWEEQVPAGKLPRGRSRISFLGFEINFRGPRINLRRPFMSRFGDIAKIEADGRELDVTLKSGSVVHLDRYSADDFADGVRVWDAKRGVVDFGERPIRTIEFLPPARPSASDPHQLYGTVRTREGDFTGFLEWDREGSVGMDELHGLADEGELVSLPFATIRSIARASEESARVTLLDDRQVVLSGDRSVGEGHAGIYVDDVRYGRVLISWDAFERVDFKEPGPGVSGPAYGDFPAGGPLMGTVTTRDGRRLAGRLVYDLDESEITETLDAPSRGVDYTIPFGLVGSIVIAGREGPARVMLRSGEELQLERSGDLGELNAGLLIFVDGREHPEYVSWSDVARVDFDPPASMYPSVAGG
jgi:hypothetical protein